jgi:pyruvate formate lyase activating enzyme
VTRLNESPTLDEDQVLSFLATRRGLLDGVVLSGGEPLLQKGVESFLAKVRSLGFSVKLDTNGCYPEALERILAAGLVDYVAMDVKNCPDKYPLTVGIPGFSIEPIQRSLELLAASGIDYELRTTVVRQFHTPADIESLAKWISGAPRYVLQNFVDSGNLIGTGLDGFSQEALETLAEAAKKHLPFVQIRGE